MKYIKLLCVLNITLFYVLPAQAMEENTQFNVIENILNQHELEATFSNMMTIAQPVITQYGGEVCFTSQNYHQLKIGMGEDPNENDAKIVTQYLPPQQCWLVAKNKIEERGCSKHCRIDDDESQIKTQISRTQCHLLREDGKYNGNENIFDGINKKGFAILCSSRKAESVKTIEKEDIDLFPAMDDVKGIAALSNKSEGTGEDKSIEKKPGHYKNKNLTSILNLFNTKAAANKKNKYGRKIYQAFPCTEMYENWFITACALSNVKKGNDRAILCRTNNTEQNAFDLLEITTSEKSANNTPQLAPTLFEQAIAPRFTRMSFITKNTALGLSEHGNIFTIALTQKTKVTKKPHLGLTLSKKFFYTTEKGKKEKVRFKDFAIDEKHRPSMLLLTQDNKFFHCNLATKEIQLLFEEKEKDITQIWLHNHKIGFYEKDSKGATQVTIMPLALFLYQNKAQKKLSTQDTGQ